LRLVYFGIRRTFSPMSHPKLESLGGVLVTGGAGYIGSHVVKTLVQNGIGSPIVVLDNLSEGYEQAISPKVTFVKGNLDDGDLIRKVMKEHNIGAVIHMAAFIQVGESGSDPLKYYRNNIGEPITLLECMRDAGVEKLVFASTAAVYGDPQRLPLDEEHPREPINPYGFSKFAFEQILADCETAHQIRSVSLRFFNAGGSSLDGTIGEAHQPETHLIPRILMAISGEADGFKVFGSDYDTPDGTCVRDFIHVLDLAKAMICALEYLTDGGETLRCNLGTGKGFSVKEMIDAAEEVTGQKLKVEYCDRRPGDPPLLVADPTLAKEVLGWEAQFTDVKQIVESAWLWFGADHKGKYQ